MTAPPPLRLAILISGRGSNMAAIARACATRTINARVACVGTDRADAAGLDTARALGIDAFAVLPAAYASRPEFETALAARLDECRPDLVVLAGFMRILGDAFVARYRGRMLNIHPSLLPKYKGLHTHRRALAAGDPMHGCSVHFVTEELDGGPVVLQGRLRVAPGEDEQRLSARVQALEHIVYPRAIGWIAAGRLAWRDDRVWLDDKLLTAPITEDFDGPATG
ncbi:MAG TPA: phosphoribosylglycinamide formyltransferase [Steroidobacteraceae bacterium]|nr:phosphoribosylglycinamide formyltransferase [Steroidobacteraceae bacterium]HNS27436.1 phosphoribosylglycinamide formyltransferase [Steroidobacteraceae bacterium]